MKLTLGEQEKPAWLSDIAIRLGGATCSRSPELCLRLSERLLFRLSGGGLQAPPGPSLMAREIEGFGLNWMALVPEKIKGGLTIKF